MTTAIDAKALADMLDDLLDWLRANPGKDLSDFADAHHCSVEDIADSWNTYFSPDFTRHYKIDTDYDNHYHPAPPPHGDVKALKSYIVQEVNTYQQYTTVNNIEDNSFNQQIIADDVHQDIDIDNSDNVADHGGVVVRDSDVDDSNVVTGDHAAVGNENSNVLTGDVSSSADDGAQSATNINFGSGNDNTTTAIDDHSTTRTDNSIDDSFKTDNSIDDSFKTDNSIDDSFKTDNSLHDSLNADDSFNPDNSDHSDHSDNSDNSTHSNIHHNTSVDVL